MICWAPLKTAKVRGITSIFIIILTSNFFETHFRKKNYKKTMFRSLGYDVQVEAKANEIYIEKYKLGHENEKQYNSVFNMKQKLTF